MLVIDKNDFLIIKTVDGYRLTRIDNDFDQHTHLRSKSACYSIIHNVVSKKIPKNTSYYYLTSLIRLSDDELYITKLKELIKTRKSKGVKTKYYNTKKKR